MTLDPDAAAKLQRFAALVADSPHNLVSRSAKAELLTRHVPECIALAAMLPVGPARLMDIGSGGGFPGLVIAIVRPELDVHLLDSTKKKTRFLQEASRELGVPVTVHTGRAEELSLPPLERSYDVVTARAVAPLRKLIPWALPYLADQGVFYAVKGEKWRQELDQAANVLQRVRGHVIATPDDQATDPGTSATEPRPSVVMIGRAR